MKNSVALISLALATAFTLLVGAGQVTATHGVGVVFVDDSDPTSDAGGCGNIANPCNLIQTGINHAASGTDTVRVAAGTYPENLNLAKNLRLEGAQAATDACDRPATGESIVTGSGTLLELDTGSANSTIDGFTFSGGATAILSDTGPIDNLRITNNRVIGFTSRGIFLDDNGINITLDQNLVDGTSKVGGGGLVHLDVDNFDGFHFTNNCVVNGVAGTGFFVDGNHNVDAGLLGSPTPTTGARIPQFTGNLINRNGTGTNLGSRSWGDGPISGNTFSNNGFDGLQGGPRNAAISRNSFERNGRSGLALTSFGNTTDPNRGGRNNTIRDNCFARNAVEGIFFSATQFAGTISTNRANFNNLTGNTMGMRYLGAETIDGTNNWWGAADGPGPPDGTGSGDGVDAPGSGQILFVPFLVVPNPATPACPAGAAATLTLSPKTATNDVDTQHCVTATVTDTAGNPPVPGVVVRFSVTGSVNTSGSATTNASGQATFCYTGPALPGADAIRAYADNDNDSTQDAGEPFDTATKTWVAPTSTPLCEVNVTYGGRITAANGDRATFGGNAKVDKDGNPQGQEEYQDHGPVQPMNVHSINVLSVVCPSTTEASIFGDATIDGSGTFAYRIDVKDLGEPGKGVDKYRIRLSNGYDSGEQTLQGGNIQIHK